MRSSSLALCAMVALGCSEAPPSESDRLEARLDRTPVHFHLALRARLEGPDGEATARRVVAGARGGADAALADAIFADRALGRERLRERGPSDGVLSRRLVPNGRLDPGSDRALFFLALAAEAVEDEHRIPKQVLVYEASRLSPDAISDPVLRTLAQSVAALTYARAGYCDRVGTSVRAARRAPLTEAEVAASTRRWRADPALDAADIHRDLVRARTVMLGGAEACCALRRGRDADAADSIEGWVEEAEAMEIDAAATGVLRAWVAFSRGERAAAQAHLSRALSASADAPGSAEYRLIRDALASEDSAAVADATERLVDRQWISRLVLAGSRGALARDGILAAGEARAEVVALRRLAAGEAALIALARERQPLFDAAHQGDRGTVDRISSLFD